VKARQLFASTVAAAALVATVVPQAAQAAQPATIKPAGTVQGTASLASVLAPYANSWNSTWGDYNVVTHAVFAVLAAKPGSAVGVLADGKVALTAFVPTDRAFQRLVYRLTGHEYATESQVYSAVLTLGVPTIEKVLLYHVVPGATITSAMAVKANGAQLTTALGPSIRVRVTKGPLITLVDADRYLPNAQVNLGKVDINKGNRQIAHGVTHVLLPLPLKPVV